MQAPKKISRPKPFLLKFEWPDGFEATIEVKTFRKECPCAECKGESIAGKVISFPKIDMFKPGQYDLKQIIPVGNYAITAIWGDGHDSGIYDWAYLRSICEKNALTDDEIKELERKHEDSGKTAMN
jgi:DUF971 family protein